MKNICVKKEDVKYKLAFQILGGYVMAATLGFALMVWESIFFERHKWLTRKNVLKHLQSNPKINVMRYSHSGDYKFTFEDGSSIYICFLKGKFWEWSLFSSEGKCVLTHGMSLSTQVIDRQVQEILQNILVQVKEQENERNS